MRRYLLPPRINKIWVTSLNFRIAAIKYANSKHYGTYTITEFNGYMEEFYNKLVSENRLEEILNA